MIYKILKNRSKIINVHVSLNLPKRIFFSKISEGEGLSRQNRKLMRI